MYDLNIAIAKRDLICEKKGISHTEFCSLHKTYCIIVNLFRCDHITWFKYPIICYNSKNNETDKNKTPFQNNFKKSVKKNKKHFPYFAFRMFGIS